jgi:hypothetical protein
MPAGSMTLAEIRDAAGERRLDFPDSPPFGT